MYLHISRWVGNQNAWTAYINKYTCLKLKFVLMHKLHPIKNKKLLFCFDERKTIWAGKYLSPTLGKQNLHMRFSFIFSYVITLRGTIVLAILINTYLLKTIFWLNMLTLRLKKIYFVYSIVMYQNIVYRALLY